MQRETRASQAGRTALVAAVVTAVAAAPVFAKGPFARISPNAAS